MRSMSHNPSTLAILNEPAESHGRETKQTTHSLTWKHHLSGFACRHLAAAPCQGAQQYVFHSPKLQVIKNWECKGSYSCDQKIIMWLRKEAKVTATHPFVMLFHMACSPERQLLSYLKISNKKIYTQLALKRKCPFRSL